jgi:hypothetical protein
MMEYKRSSGVSIFYKEKSQHSESGYWKELASFGHLG